MGKLIDRDLHSRRETHRWIAVFIALSLGQVVAMASAVLPGEIAASAPPPIAQISFKPCAEDVSLECGLLPVAVDHRRPKGEHFDMAVIRARATDPARRLGVLVVNPGGPGGSGVDFVLGGIRSKAPIASRLREYFDIVSFDPRGVKRSHPVHCAADLPLPVEQEGDHDDLVRYLDEVGRRFAAGCATRSGEFAFSLSVSNVARDMEALRHALGEPQINYVGISFGTQLGAVYASLFPQRVRALVLDAGIAPETDGQGLFNFWMEHGAAFDIAFQRLDALCRSAASCRLKNDGVVRTFDELSARLKAKPLQVNGVMLTKHEFDWVIGESLYSERLWPAIVDALYGLRGDDAALLLQLRKEALRPPNNLPAMMPMLCGSYSGRTMPSRMVALDAAFTAVHPRFYGRSQPRLAHDRHGTAFATALCGAWPKQEPTVIRNVGTELAASPLLLANTFDNATPPSWTARLGAALGFGERAILRYEGGGHGISTAGLPCIDDAVVRYLTTLAMPEPGASCPARPIRFAP